MNLVENALGHDASPVDVQWIGADDRVILRVGDLAAGRDCRSNLARKIGAKGYHDIKHSGGILPVEN